MTMGTAPIKVLQYYSAVCIFTADVCVCFSASGCPLANKQRLQRQLIAGIENQDPILARSIKLEGSVYVFLSSLLHVTCSIFSQTGVCRITLKVMVVFLEKSDVSWICITI